MEGLTLLVAQRVAEVQVVRVASPVVQEVQVLTITDANGGRSPYMELFFYVAPGAVLSDYDGKTFFTNCVPFTTSSVTAGQTAWVLSTNPTSFATYTATYNNYVIDISTVTSTAGRPDIMGATGLLSTIATQAAAISSDLATLITAASGTSPASLRLTCSNFVAKGAPAMEAWPNSLMAYSASGNKLMSTSFYQGATDYKIGPAGSAGVNTGVPFNLEFDTRACTFCAVKSWVRSDALSLTFFTACSPETCRRAWSSSATLARGGLW